MFATLLTDWSQTCLNHTFDLKASDLSGHGCSGPVTPDNEDQCCVPRGQAQQKLHAASEPSVSFSSLFMAPEGRQKAQVSPQAKAKTLPLAAVDASQKPQSTQLQLPGTAGKDTNSRDYSVWTRAEEDHFQAVAAARADLPQKAFCQAVCQRVPNKTHRQVLGYYKRIERRLYALIPPEDRQMLTVHVNLKHSAISSHWRLLVEASGQSQHSSRRMLETLKADPKLDNVQHQLQQEVVALRAVAAADKAAHEAGRARTAAQNAAKRPGHYQQPTQHLDPAVPSQQQQSPLVGSMGSQWRLQPSSTFPATHPMSDCQHQQHMLQQQRPQQLIPQDLSYKQPMQGCPVSRDLPNQAISQHNQQLQLQQSALQLQQARLPDTVTSAAQPANLCRSPGTARLASHTIPHPHAAVPEIPGQHVAMPPMQQEPVASFSYAVLPMPPPPLALPAVKPLQLHPMSPSVDANSAKASGETQSRFTLQFVPQDESARLRVEATGVSPYQQLVRIKPSKEVHTLAAHLCKKWGIAKEPCLRLSPTHAALAGNAKVKDILKGPEADSPQQLCYSWDAADTNTVLPSSPQQQSLPKRSHIVGSDRQSEMGSAGHLSPQPLNHPVMSVTAQLKTSLHPASVHSSRPAADATSPTMQKAKKRNADEPPAIKGIKRRADTGDVSGNQGARYTCVPEHVEEARLTAHDAAASMHAPSDVSLPVQPSDQQLNAPLPNAQVTRQCPGSLASDQHTHLPIGRPIISSPQRHPSPTATSDAVVATDSAPVHTTSVKQASQQQASGSSAFPDLFGQQAVQTAKGAAHDQPSHRQQSANDLRSPVGMATTFPQVDGQGQQQHAAPVVSLPHAAMRDFSSLFGGSGSAAEDSCDAFAAAGLHRNETNAKAGADGQQKGSSPGCPTPRNGVIAGSCILQDLISARHVNQHGNADMANMLHKMCNDEYSNISLPARSQLDSDATTTVKAAGHVSPSKADRNAAGGALPASRAEICSPVGRSRLSHVSFSGHRPLPFADLGDVTQGAHGSGLSQLELDVGSLLCGGDSNSWDRPHPTSANARSHTTQPPEPPDSAAPRNLSDSRGAFHELFPRSRS